MTVLTGARVVLPDGVLEQGWVRVLGDRIASVGDGRAPDDEKEDLGDGYLLPGFIDIHVHGGGGHDVAASPEDMAEAVAFHRRHGTAATLISLVTAPVDALCEQLSWAADLAERGPGPTGHVIGSHLEGPFLSRPRCGAQNPDYLLPPDRGALAALIEAGRGHLRTVTVTPELPGALDLVDDLVDAGIVAAVGHTDATYSEAAVAFGRGASLATHLFNAMRPIHHREPGAVFAALDHVACEIINDGVHVHPALLRTVTARGPDRLVLITDAIAAAGVGDGRYTVGGRSVVVVDGQARLEAGGGLGPLAGSTITMVKAVGRALRDRLPTGFVAAAAATNPARLLGVDGRRGSIGAGLDADLVLLGDDFELRGVMVQGKWSAASPSNQEGCESDEE